MDFFTHEPEKDTIENVKRTFQYLEFIFLNLTDGNYWVQ
jgi:hypothetical protein